MIIDLDRVIKYATAGLTFGVLDLKKVKDAIATIVFSGDFLDEDDLANMARAAASKYAIGEEDRRAASITIEWRIGLRKWGDAQEQAAARLSDEDLAVFMLRRARAGASSPHPGTDKDMADAEFVARVLWGEVPADGV